VSPQPLAYALIAALANVLGAAAVTSRARWSMRALDVMVALSAGFMIAVSVGELLPEAIGRGGRNAALARMWDLVALLRHKDVAMQVVRTYYPGQILYVDDFQVVAELPRLRARRPLVARRRCV